MSYLFHTDVFMPQRYRQPVFEGVLRYGPHAKNARQSDRFGSFDLPRVFCAANAQLIEVEYDEQKDKIVKQVWRQQLDDRRDIVLVICPNGFVRTAWINLRSDKHKTLNAARYVRR
jgi:hypothetical protein